MRFFLKQLFKHLLGWICIILGLIMLITPGQGLLTLLAGIYLLADEIPMFGKIKSRLQKKFPKADLAVKNLKKRFSSKKQKSPKAEKTLPK